MTETIRLELTREEFRLLLQGCSVGLQVSGILLPDERSALRELIQKMAKESRNDEVQAPGDEQSD
jgi:hypothetical protein